MIELSSAEAVGIAARYAAQIRELLTRNTEAADALRKTERNTALDESALRDRPRPSASAIDLRT